MEKKNLAEVHWILFSNKELYDFWRAVCNKYLSEELLDGHGNITGVQKDTKALTMAWTISNVLKELEVRRIFWRFCLRWIVERHC